MLEYELLHGHDNSPSADLVNKQKSRHMDTHSHDYGSAHS